MELVIELEGSLHRLRIGTDPTTVGRAYHSDLLLQDKSVDADHLTLASNADPAGATELIATDLHSVNGSRLNGQPMTPGTPITVASGDLLELGKARLRIYRRDHPVPPAHSPTRMEQLQQALSQSGALIATTVLGLALFLWLDYLHFGGDLKANVAVRKVMDFGLQAGLWMLFWATVSKLVRGEFNFRPHWCLGVILAVLAPVLDEALSIIGFNWQSLHGYQLLDALSSAAVVIASVFIALSFTTALGVRARMGIATLPALLLLLTSYALPLITEPRSVSSPKMLSVSRPPAFKWVGSEPASALIVDSDQLFQRARDVAREQLEAEARETASIDNAATP